MITKQNLQEAIAECQGVRSPNASTCLKLAAYYTIKDHLFEDQTKEVPSYSYATQSSDPKTITYSNDSEFAETIKGKDTNEVLSVIDELMNTLNIINPRLYEGVMAKLLY